MKKLVLSIVLMMGLALGAQAQYFGQTNDNQQGGGLFGRGNTPEQPGSKPGGTPLLPPHGEDDDYDAAPIGSGVLLLLGMGAAYAVAKRRKK